MHYYLESLYLHSDLQICFQIIKTKKKNRYELQNSANKN